MTEPSLSAICAGAGTLVAASIAWLRDEALSARNGALLPALVSGVLVPLMLPRVNAKLRGVRFGERRPGQSQIERFEREPDLDACMTANALETLLDRNAKLTRELTELRAAYAELAHDAAAQARTVDRLAHLAYHDPLTRLPNRLLIMDRLGQALTAAQRAGSGVLLMYLDLDNFKTINDTLGHAAGDRVLTEIAARIAGCLRASDTAGRVGGDEFVLVCPTSNAAGDAAQLRARLQAAITAPIDIDGTPVVTGASVGTSMYPADGCDAEELITRADRAMYGGKAAGRR